MVVFELLFNAILTVFFIFAFIYMAATKPEPLPYQIGSEVWPLFVLGVLIILLLINMLSIIRKNKDKIHVDEILPGIRQFFKSKLFLQAILIVAYAIVIEYVGFVPSTLLLCFASILLIGNPSKKVALLGAVTITLVVYVVFAWGLEVMLPRGYGIFRDFALMLEIF